jgi:hypothetical protein
MAGGVHGPGHGTAFVDKGVGISTRFANLFGAGGGPAVAGHARTYMGKTYAEKPAFKKMFTDPAAYTKAAATFKEERVAKHRDRLMEELVKPQPDLKVIKTSVSKLSKVASGHPFRFAPHVPDAGPGRAAMATQWSRIRQGIADVLPHLPKGCQASLTRLDAAADVVESAIAKADALDAKAATYATATLGEVHDATKHIAYSTDGAHGAFLVRPAQGAPIESVLKCDDKAAMENAFDISKMIHHVATHADVGLPFDFPTHKIVDASQTEKATIKGMLTQLRTGYQQQLAGMAADDPNHDAISTRIVSLKIRLDNLENEGKVLKQEGLPGVIPSSLTTTEKIALCNDAKFAQDCGMMTLLAPMFALGDHLALNGAGNNSMTNFIYDPTTKRLGVIDLSAKEHGSQAALLFGTDPANYCAVGLKDVVADLRSVARTGTETNVGAKFMRLNSMDNGASRSLLTPGTMGNGDMFGYNERQAVNDPANGVDKNKFAANFLAGVVKAIDFMERNAEVFAAAHAQRGNAWTGQEVTDIVNAAGALKPADRKAIIQLAKKVNA